MNSTEMIPAFLRAVSLFAASDPKGAGKHGAKTVPAADLIDVNSATPRQLETLPAIGKVFSSRVINGRPYKNKNELVDRRILPPSVFAKISNRIIAREI
ncbi:MAG: helix-hairpin-helix domain-containing protein [Bryobacteraceae bacterium]